LSFWNRIRLRLFCRKRAAVKAYSDMAHYHEAGIVGYAYIVLNEDNQAITFRCGYFSDAEVRSGKHPETKVHEMVMEEYPYAVLYSDYVSGPYGARKASRRDPMILLCHHAAREQAMVQLLQRANQNYELAATRLKQLRKPQTKVKARQFLSSRQ